MACAAKRKLLHDLILGQACGFGLHGIHATRSLVLDEGQSKRATAILVPRELLDRSIGALSSVKSNDPGSSRAAVWLILNFGLLNLSDCGEELDKIFVASRPWKLSGSLATDIMIAEKPWHLRCGHK